LRYKTLSRVIEYGADHTLKVTPNIEDRIKYPFLKEKYAVTVCRIEPENNIHIVLEAFKQTEKMKLVIVGNWNNSQYGKNLKKTYTQYPNITLLDPIYKQREINLIRGNAHLYIHGHAAGGTNPSLVEAMYLQLPILAYRVSYNKTTTENKAIYFDSEDELETTLISIYENKLKEISLAMKSIADRRYTWKTIARQYDLLLKEAIANKSKTAVHAEVHKLNTPFLEDLHLGHLKNQQLFYENR
jgi:glycosyltransferase involved in cell wall biosynthesis